MHDGLLIGRAVVPRFGFLECRKLEHCCAFEGGTLSHTESTIGTLGIRWWPCADKPAFSAYRRISSGSWTDSRSATKNAGMDLLTQSITNYDLAKHVAVSVVRPCRLRLREWKHAVNHGVHGVRLDRALHRLYVDAAPDADAAERRLTHEKAHEIQTSIALRECPDERNLAPVRHSLEGLRERPRPTHLNDALDASPGGERAHGLRPLRILDVVDDGLRAQRLQPLAILRAGRGCDHAGSEELGEVQREQRPTARALRQHR